MTSTEKDSTTNEPGIPFEEKYSKTHLTPEQQEQQRLGQEQYARRLSLNPFYRRGMTEEEAFEFYRHSSMGIIYYTERGCSEFCVNGISLLLRHPVIKLDSKPV